jgi:ADP-ribosylglycohydrolase
MNAAGADALPFEGANPAPRELDRRQRAAVNSALWAAWGDAVGWISELTDEAGLRRRTHGRPLRGPIPWTRRIGGRGGVSVDLPAGTYSDDTQLRLAVCRAYSPAGFDPEAFSAVELTVWPCYALGGGTGTKAAAAHMVKPGSRWSANQPPNYVNSGGNGAAMRVQPHAWHAPRPPVEMLRDVMRDAVTTHGHPNGLIGAALSALAVADSLPGGEGSLAQDDGPRAWRALLDQTSLMADIPEHDPELHAYWLPNWAHPELGSWRDAVTVTIREVSREVAAVGDATRAARSLQEGYRNVLGALGLRDPARRGSGVHTVIAALALVSLTHRFSAQPDAALLCAVNELDTDTDTIATMAGAILGCSVDHRPDGPLLDSQYIASEAARIASAGQPAAASFTYPDLLAWEPPKTLADGLLDNRGELAVAGLGPADALEPPKAAPRSDFGWQWVRLHTSQTLLIKRRVSLPSATPASLPLPAPGPQRPRSTPPVTPRQHRDDATPPTRGSASSDVGSLQAALTKVRESNYDVRVIGINLARLARDEGAAIAAAYGALVAAELAALRKRDQPR